MRCDVYDYEEVAAFTVAKCNTSISGEWYATPLPEKPCFCLPECVSLLALFTFTGTCLSQLPVLFVPALFRLHSFTVAHPGLQCQSICLGSWCSCSQSVCSYMSHMCLPCCCWCLHVCPHLQLVGRAPVIKWGFKHVDPISLYQCFHSDWEHPRDGGGVIWSHLSPLVCNVVYFCLFAENV
jgi:hypothetical protein